MSTLYYYKALGEDGHVDRGYVVQKDEKQAYHWLQEKSLQPILIKQAKGFSNRKITIHKWGEIFYDLYTYSKCLNLSDALLFSAENTKAAHTQAILYQIKADLDQGTPLSKAFKKHIRDHNLIFITYLKQAEVHGNYNEAFFEIQKYCAWQDLFMKNITQKLTYPFFIFAILILLFFGLAFFVVPSLAPIYKEYQVDSFSLRLLLAIETSPFSSLMVLFGVVFVSLGGGYLFKKSKSFFHKLPLPLKKMIFFKDGPTFTKEWAICHENNTSISKTFLNLQDIVAAKPYLQKVVMDIEAKIKAGESIFSACNQISFFPELLKKMIHAGESTGTLSENLLLFSETLLQQQQRKLDRFLSILQPMALLIMGGGVLWLVLGLIAPLYDVLIKLQ